MATPLETWPQIQRRHLTESNALIAAAIRETGGNILAASVLLKMPRKTVQRRVRENDIPVIRAPRK